ncbi:hypothetical protein [Haloarcula sebkhae]|uniref:Uncharacterized protein n=2 Tax=Haloarcula sebkhae TaxID=932660 RepID=A0ACC6VRN8_9EURY|nr:hypothetical protein [Haloarcula sebkhae]
MMAQSISEFVEYEEQDGVGIWYIEDMPAAVESGDMEQAEQHYVETASDPDMYSVIVEIGNVENANREVLEHVNKNWTEVSEESGVKTTAYVADGLSRLAISQNNEAKSVTTKGFEDFDDALEWAQEQQQKFMD